MVHPINYGTEAGISAIVATTGVNIHSWNSSVTTEDTTVSHFHTSIDLSYSSI